METNDEAVQWLERKFEREFRPGGGQRLDVAYEGSRGEEMFDPNVTIRPPAHVIDPRPAGLAALRRTLRLRIFGRE